MDASVVGHTHRMKDDRRVKGIEEEKQEDVGLVLDKRGGKGGGKVEGIRGRERERVHANMLYAQARSLVTAQ